MNTRSLITVFVFTTISPRIATAQGSLTPPGPPAPVMKTLDQIEARTPVNAVTCPGDAGSQFVISQPGSYYLTGNLTGVAGKDGITITAGNVTLDLNGFTLTGVPGAIDGIRVSGYNISVCNGTAANWPANGIDGFNSVSALYERITARGCGKILANSTKQGSGIAAGVATTVVHCSLLKNVGAGVTAGMASIAVSDCTAYGNGLWGFLLNSGSISDCVSHGNENGFVIAAGATAMNCSAQYNTVSGFTGEGVYQSCTAGNNKDCGFHVTDGAILRGCQSSLNGDAGGATGTGFCADDGCTFESCNASYNHADGFRTGNYSSIRDCTAFKNTGDGFNLSGKSVIRGCVASANGTGAEGAGIHAVGPGNRIEGNETRDNKGHGIRSDFGPAGDFILSNSSLGNPVNYVPATGAAFAPVQSLSTQTHPLANH